MANSGQVVNIINDKNIQKLLQIYDNAQDILVQIRLAIVKLTY